MLSRFILRFISILFLSCLATGCVILSYLDDAELFNPEVRSDPIPFELFGDAGSVIAYRLLIPCTIAGREGRCIFDTGAHDLVVHNCNDHLPLQGESRSFGVARKSVRQEQVTLNNVVIGKRIYRNIVARRLGGKYCDDEQGVVGIGIFKDDLCLDFASMTLAESGCEDIPLDHAFEYKWNKILIASKLGGKTVLSLFDTGAARSFLDSYLVPDLTRRGVKIPRTDGLSAGDINGTRFAIGAFYRTNIDVFSLGEQTINVSTTDLQRVRNLMREPIDFVVGLDVIQKYRWRFDFRTQKWGAEAL